MRNIAKTLSSRITGNREGMIPLSLFASLVTKPLSLFVGTFFSPRIIVAEVVVDDCVIYSSTKNFQ